MSGFSADWLALREPYDHRARAIRGLPDGQPCGLVPAGPLRLVDLGCGSGSNLRYLAPRLGGVQHWRLIDDDPGLLAALRARLHDWAATIQARFDETAEGVIGIDAAAFRLTAVTQAADLGVDAGGLALQPGECVTASALLDLVSAPWLDALITACAAGSHPLLWALTYDGRIEWTPHDPLDAFVHDRIDHHQRRDKGFGAALGPTAARHAMGRLAPLASAILVRRSDWVLGPQDQAIQRALIDDWTAAACQIAPERRADVEHWARRRRAIVDAGRSRLRVGHVDLAAGFSG